MHGRHAARRGDPAHRGWASARWWPAVRPGPGSVNDGSGLAVAGSRQQVEFRGPADRCPAAGHGELGVDVLGVRPHGVQGHHELAGDGRAVQLGSEQPEHVELAFAQRVDQGLF